MRVLKALKIVAFFAFGLSFVVSGCTIHASQKGRTLQQVVKDGDGPVWFVKDKKAFGSMERAFYGVGNSARGKNPSLMRKNAQASARRDVAKQFKMYIAILKKQYIANIAICNDDPQSQEQAEVNTVKEITDSTLQSVTIEDYWEHPERNEGYALARLDLEIFLDKARNYENAKTEKNLLCENIRQHIEENAKETFDRQHIEINKTRI